MSMQIILKVLALRHRLRQRDRWTPRLLEEHQDRALRLLREHAYARSPFYGRFHRGLTDRSLSELPILTKEMVMEHFDELVTDPTVRLADVRCKQRDKGQRERGSSYEQRSSGAPDPSGGAGTSVFDRTSPRRRHDGAGNDVGPRSAGHIGDQRLGLGFGNGVRVTLDVRLLGRDHRGCRPARPLPQRSLSLLSWNLCRSCSKAAGWIRTSPWKG